MPVCNPSKSQIQVLLILYLVAHTFSVIAIFVWACMVCGTTSALVYVCSVLHRTSYPLADRESPLIHMPHRNRIINYQCKVHVPQCVALFNNTFDSAAYEVVERRKGERPSFLLPGNPLSWVLLFRMHWSWSKQHKNKIYAGVMHEAHPLRTHEWWINLRV